MCTNVYDSMPVHIQLTDTFEYVEVVCILENVAMLCSSSLQPQANPGNSYAHLHAEVFFAL